jgi:hypothetical protein
MLQMIVDRLTGKTRCIYEAAEAHSALPTLPAKQTNQRFTNPIHEKNRILIYLNLFLKKKRKTSVLTSH